MGAYPTPGGTVAPAAPGVAPGAPGSAYGEAGADSATAIAFGAHGGVMSVSTAPMGVPTPHTIQALHGHRDPTVKPPCALVSFGFGGKVLFMFPRPKRKLGLHAGPQPDDQGVGSTDEGLRKGPIKIYSTGSIFDMERWLPNAPRFPGPLLHAPNRQVPTPATRRL